MTDMRATEDLLEVIADEATEIVEALDPPAKHAGAILEAAVELRRRGDTLVRRDDLRILLRHVDPFEKDEASEASLERIRAAIGGDL
jgi:hypothetical protein